MRNTKEETHENVHFPCICTEIARWEKPVDSKVSDFQDLDAATVLLRCQASSSRGLHIKSVTRLERAESQTDSAYYAGYLNRFLQPLSVGLNYLHYTWVMWRTPSSALITFARLHGRSSPWKIGILPSRTPHFSEVYMVSDGLMEAIRVRNPIAPMFVTGQHAAESERNALQELETVLSLSFSSDEEKDELHTNNSESKPFRRWQLRYIDPWPSWRYLTFYVSGSFDSCRRLAAIAYSNGSVEVINLFSATESNCSPMSRSHGRAQVLIPAPFDPKTKVPQANLFPVVHVAFMDDEHLLVCHFRGHVDLWHIDWSAQKFPTRLMGRIIPSFSGYTKSSPVFLPLLAADFDHLTQCLVLAGLPKASGALHERLDLRVYQVSKKIPFLTLKSNMEGSKQPIARAVVSKLSHSKVMLGHLLNKFIRVSALEQSRDAVSFVRINSGVPNGTIAGVLQTSGTCSIWSVPELEPLCIVIGADEPPSPRSLTPVDSKNRPHLSTPFCLTWWHSRTQNDETVQLAVLREDGTLNILKFNDSKTNWLSLPEHQIRELGLHPFATFAHTSLDTAYLERTGELLVIDFAMTIDSHSTELLNSRDLSLEKPIVRAIQLASTTETGLFCHFIHSGRYEEAITLAEQYKLDVELVYQQQWLHLAVQIPYLADFEKLISSTLGLIRHRPLWVILQCLTFLPPTTVSSLVSSEHLFSAMRNLLNHGLCRLRSLSPSQSERVPESTRNILEHRLLQQLEHIDVVRMLLPMGSDPLPAKGHHSMVYDIRPLVSSLRSFRHHALLDIAIEYAHAGRFAVVQQLMGTYPLSVGRFRLAIATSLPETVHPSLFVDFLLNPDFSRTEESIYATREELERLSLTRLGDLWEEFHYPLDNRITPLAYAKRLAKWLISRAQEIEALTGLTNLALVLIESGGKICYELTSSTMDCDYELSALLWKLRRLRWNLAFLEEIVYRKPDVNDQTHHIRATVQLQSKSQPVVLARLRLSEFNHMALEDRLDMLIQLRSGKQSNTTTKEESDAPLWELLTNLLIHYCGSSSSERFTQLVTFCLWRMVVVQGLSAIQCVLDPQTVGLGTTTKLSGVATEHWWSEKDSWTSIPVVAILTGTLHVIQKYQPPVNEQKSLDRFYAYSQNVLKTIRSVTACTDSFRKKCLPGDLDSFGKISAKLDTAERCGIGLGELCDLVRDFDSYLGSSGKMDFMSIGLLMDASVDGAVFRRFLTRWVAIVTRLALAQDIKERANSATVEPEITLEELAEIVTRLHDILKRTFSDCPAEHWISLGLQFSLLASGNERLLSVSEKLLSICSASTLSTPVASNWLLCLLLAVRSYVDSTAPSPNYGSYSASKMDANERLARRCIDLFRKLPDVTAQHWSFQFDCEERLLDVSSYLAEVREVTNTSSVKLTVAPHQLRPFWCNPHESETVTQRCAVFQSSLEAIFGTREGGKHFSHLRAKLTPENLSQLARLFGLSFVDIVVCFLRTLYKRVELTYQDIQQVGSVDDWMPETLVLLADAMANGIPEYWFVCAQWAGYSLAEHLNKHVTLTCQKNPPLIDAVWTPLHAVFGVKPQAYLQSSDRIERFRIKLALFAMAHCPAKHLETMSRLLIMTLHRLARTSYMQSNCEKSSIASRLQHISMNLGHLIREHLSPSRQSDTGESQRDGLVRLPLPLFYRPMVSEESDDLDGLMKGTESVLPIKHMNSWVVLLESWLEKNPANLDPINLSGLDTAFEDGRLSQSFASFNIPILQLTGSSTYLTAFHNHLYFLAPNRTCAIGATLPTPQSLFADRLRLFLSLCALPCVYSGEYWSLSSRSCFPSSELLIHRLETCSNSLVNQWSYEAVLTSLAVALREMLPHVDLHLFDSDPDYRKDIVLNVCRSRLSFGLRLAVFCRVSLDECLYSRLTTLFVSHQVEKQEDQSEAKSIVSLIAQLPDGLIKFISWMETAIYPWLVGSFSPLYLFNIVPSSVSSTSVAGLTVQLHKDILEVLCADPSCSSLLTQISYAELIAMLLHTSPNEKNDFATHCGTVQSFRDHMLYPYLKSKALIDGLSSVLSILLSAGAASSTTCTRGDLVAMYSLQTLDGLDVGDSCFDLRSHICCSLSSMASTDSELHPHRFEMWLRDLLFNPKLKYLSVDRRRVVLQEVVKFLHQHVGDSSGLSDARWTCLLNRTVAYQAQVDRVSDLLGNVRFPGGPVGAKSQTSYFYTRFFQVQPDQTELALCLLKELAIRVLEDHSQCTDHPVSQPSTRCLEVKSRWLAEHFPDCFRALSINIETNFMFVVEVIASLVPSLDSMLHKALEKLDTQISPVRIAEVNDFSPIYVQLVKNATRDSTGIELPVRQLRLFGFILASERIRRLQGPKLVEIVYQMFRWPDDRGTDVTQVLFRQALLAASESAKPDKTIGDFVTSLPDKNQATSIYSLLNQLLEAALKPSNQSKNSEPTVDVHKLSVFIKTAAELVALVLHRGEQHAVSTDQLRTWYLWLKLGIQYGMFSSLELSRDCLVNQWVQYGIPPPNGLVCAGLEYLRTLTPENVDRTDALLFSMIVSATLYQSDMDLVESALRQLAVLKSPHISLTVDSEACLYFVCVHGTLWPRLIIDLDQSNSLKCPSFFGYVLQTVENYLSRVRSHPQRLALLKHCLHLLRSADLWIEAARLSRFTAPITPRNTALSTLVGLVRTLTDSG